MAADRARRAELARVKITANEAYSAFHENHKEMYKRWVQNWLES